MILVLDNYDSFVHNLARLVRLAGARTEVVRSDQVGVDEIRQRNPEAIIISPGPGVPADAGCSIEVVRELGAHFPTLGVCLGHQAIVEAYGGSIVRAEECFHGRTSQVEHNGQGVFAGLPSPMTVCRYHSLVADHATLPDMLSVSAQTADGHVMAVRHQSHPVFGVQFHPEAILTEGGQRLVENFVGLSTATLLR